MDFIDLIITIGILAVGGLLSGKSTKKAARSQRPSSAPRRDSEVRPQAQFVPADEEVTTTAKGRKGKNVSDRGVFGNAYFTYETPSDQPQQNNPFRETVADASAQPVSASFMGGTFDLRQAIIYQTVLERVEY